MAIHEEDTVFVPGKKSALLPGGWRGTLFRVLGVFMKTQQSPPDILLHDRDVIEGLTCIHTPGHAPGSICLLDPAAGVLFAGDLLRFDGKKIEGSPAHQSIKKIAVLYFDIMLSGNGIPLRPGASGKVREFAKTGWKRHGVMLLRPLREGLEFCERKTDRSFFWNFLYHYFTRRSCPDNHVPRLPKKAARKPMNLEA